MYFYSYTDSGVPLREEISQAHAEVDKAKNDKKHYTAKLKEQERKIQELESDVRVKLSIYLFFLSKTFFLRNGNIFLKEWAYVIIILPLLVSIIYLAVKIVSVILLMPLTPELLVSPFYQTNQKATPFMNTLAVLPIVCQFHNFHKLQSKCLTKH